MARAAERVRRRDVEHHVGLVDERGCIGLDKFHPPVQPALRGNANSAVEGLAVAVDTRPRRRRVGGEDP